MENACLVEELPLYNQDGLKLSGTNQFLIYADVNLFDGNLNTINKNTEALLEASK
jgi:hypothetical protein